MVAATRARSSTMSPRSSRGGCGRGADVGQGGPQAAEARRVVRPLAGQQPQRGVVGKGSTGERSRPTRSAMAGKRERGQLS